MPATGHRIILIQMRNYHHRLTAHTDVGCFCRVREEQTVFTGSEPPTDTTFGANLPFPLNWRQSRGFQGGNNDNVVSCHTSVFLIVTIVALKTQLVEMMVMLNNMATYLVVSAQDGGHRDLLVHLQFPFLSHHPAWHGEIYKATFESALHHGLARHGCDILRHDIACRGSAGLHHGPSYNWHGALCHGLARRERSALVDTMPLAVVGAKSSAATSPTVDVMPLLTILFAVEAAPLAKALPAVDLTPSATNTGKLIMLRHDVEPWHPRRLRGSILVNIFLHTQKLPVALCSCIFVTKDYQFSRKLTFFRNFTGASIFGLLFSCLPWVAVGCPFSPLFTLYSSLASHFQDACWTCSLLLADFFFMFKWLSYFYIVLLCKSSSRCRHYFTFHFSKKSLTIHAIYLFI